MITRVAVIDTGTNSTRLLVAEVEGKQVRELERRTAITRLGEGVDDAGYLHEDAKERVRRCVADYAKIISRYHPAKTIVLATSSVRDATDGRKFISELAKAYGFSSRVLPGEEEASLSFLGTTLGIDKNSRIMLVDIGGGSTEIATGRDGSIDFASSLEMGCVRITERFLHSDPVTASELEEATSFIDGILSQAIDKSRIGSIDKTFAVAGTVTALAAIDLGLKRYDRNAVHGHILTREKINGLLSRLAKMDVRQRLKIDTMEKGRADVIVGGTLIAARFMNYARVEEFIISEQDILDGAAVEIAALT